MLTQKELDLLSLEAENAVSEVLNQFAKDFLGERMKENAQAPATEPGPATETTYP